MINILPVIGYVWLFLLQLKGLNKETSSKMNRLSSSFLLSSKSIIVEKDEEDENSCNDDPFSTITIIDENNNRNNADLASASEPVSTVTHIIFLIHGWMGNALEMDYIRESIQNAAEAAAVATTKNSDNDERHHRFVIHSAGCNEDRTNDGIVAGGARIANEINSLVRYIVDGGGVGGHCSNDIGNDEDDSNNSKIHSDPVTLSIIGNSLGGLYARQSLVNIDWNLEEFSSSSSSSPSITLTPMIFLTTATPHLGISGHTYFPLPRAAEFVVAKGMQETGKDFFRFNTILEDLFHKQYHTDPLARFQQRIAYVNVYGTDFQVPTATAAFWAPGSDSIHYKVRTTTDTNTCTDTVQEENDVDSKSSVLTSDIISTPKEIVMMLTTPRQIDLLNEEKEENDGHEKNENRKQSQSKDDDRTEVYRAWSKRLDAMGWTKVLVDVRENVPSVPVRSPTPSEVSSVDSYVKGDDDSSDSSDNTSIVYDNNNNEDDDDKSNKKEDNNDIDIDMCKEDTWTAGELLTKFKGGLMTTSGTNSIWSLKPRIPLGHTVMIANAKDEFNRKVTEGGKPVMDYLGLSLVQILMKSSSTIPTTINGR